jgi:predicted NUDIX family NTP pyrophosphohydrolase
LIMKKRSAGLLVYRKKGATIEVLLAHPGGPFWSKKDLGAWSIPKGEYDEGENPLETAKREFVEELGKDVPKGDFVELGEVEQKNNKIVIAWAIEGDLDVTRTTSNTFEIEWPPHSGKMQDFPEIDRAKWFTLTEAAKKLFSAQTMFLERLADKLNVKFEPTEEPHQAKLF